MNLTEISKQVFIRHAKDSGNWSGTPIVSVTKEERGNLTQLKRAKLLTTFISNGEEFINFTDAGKQFAADNGVTISG